MVHPSRSLLASGAAGVDRLSVRMVDPASIPAAGRGGHRSTGTHLGRRDGTGPIVAQSGGTLRADDIKPGFTL